jgi:hypothetical protein
MAEQTETPKAIGDAYDEGIDLLNLPPYPWTVEKLGEEVYCKIARISGAFNPTLDPRFRPALDPRTFASGRAANRARMFGVPLTPVEVSTPAEFEAWFNTLAPEHQHAINGLNTEASSIQDKIDAGLPAPSGTQRAAGAKPLTPAKLQFTKRMF